jgi:hypothetical protein
MEQKTLKLTAANAQKAYNKADAATKKWMKDLYPDHNFDQKLIDRIETYADACFELGITPLTISDFAALPERDQESSYAYHQLSIIARVLNEGWEPDYSDSQYKYYPCFVWNDSAAGGAGFSFRDFFFDYSRSGVGARLVFKSRELAEYAGKKFLSIYNQFLTIQS